VDPEKMTARELALVLNIHEVTIRKLVKTEQLPCYFQEKRVFFDFREVLKAFELLEESVV